jgi:hypothetical protein
MKNKFYYEWGNEKPGFVTTWKLVNGAVTCSKQESRESVIKQKLKMWCPYS